MAYGNQTMFHIQLFISLILIFTFWFFVIRAIVRHHRKVVAKRPKPTAKQLAIRAEIKAKQDKRDREKKYRSAISDLELFLVSTADSFNVNDFCYDIEAPLETIFGKSISATPLGNNTIDLHIFKGKDNCSYVITVDRKLGYSDIMIDGSYTPGAEDLVDYIKDN